MSGTTDLVASRSSFLCMYMSNHPDTLTAYVTHYQRKSQKKGGTVSGTVKSAKMTSIDSKGMTLSYITSDSATPKSVRIPFDPPLLAYDEVKPRLIAMKLDAEEDIGMAKRPQITTFNPPIDEMLTWTLIFGFIYYIALSPQLGRFGDAGTVVLDYVGGAKTGKWVVAFLLSVHVLESLYTAYLCVKHRTPLFIGVLWTSTTMIWGGPIWRELRKRIQRARIESITKAQ